MKRMRTIALAAMAVIVGANVAAASTITVSYYTTGQFCSTAACDATIYGSSVTGVANPGNDSIARVSFAGAGTGGSPLTLNNPDVPGSTNQLFGTFTSELLNGNANVGVLGSFFQLSFFQQAPSGGISQLVGTLSGQIKSDAKIDFTSQSLNIGIVTYQIPDLAIALSGNQSINTFQLRGTITHTDLREIAPTAAAVPEPGSMLLLGSGLLGVARVARRRKQANS